MTHPTAHVITTADDIIREMKEKGAFSVVLATGVIVLIVRLRYGDYYRYIVRTLAKDGQGYEQYVNTQYMDDEATRIRDCARIVLAMAYPNVDLETQAVS